MTEKLWQGWKYWKNKTQIEKDAIDSMLKAKDYILKNIPKKEIVSIYVYGSFAKRKITKKSDLDILVVLKSDDSLEFVEDTITNAVKLSNVELDISTISLNEIKHKKIKKEKRKYTPPWFFPPLAPDNFYLIYGIETFQNKFSREDLIDRYVKSIKTSISLYYGSWKPSYWFSLLKVLYYLVEDECFIKEDNFIYKRKSFDLFTYNSLENLIKEKDHIIHKVIKYLKNSEREADIKERKKFINQAKK